MNNSARWILGVAAIVVISLALVGGGMYFGRMSGTTGSGPNMMDGFASTGSTGNSAIGAMGAGMTHAPTRSAGVGGGMVSGNMMGGTYGMMGAGSAALYGIQPLSIAAAQNAVQTYLAGLHNSDLTVGEVIIFDNQAYARVDEKSTGHAALEVLVDPVTLAVYPELGANMMWNLKYGMMANSATGAGTGMMSGTGTGMTGGYAGGATAANPNDPMPVTVAQAVETAQRYLDTYLPGAKAETTADTFYGYFTLEILRNGQMVSMLSVNGYTRQVILHTWHGKFIETSAK